MANDENAPPSKAEVDALMTHDEAVQLYLAGGNEAVRAALGAAAFAKFGERAMGVVFASERKDAASQPGAAPGAPPAPAAIPHPEGRRPVAARGRGEIGPERTPGDEVPTRPGDEQRGLTVAILGHHPVHDYTILAKSDELALTRDLANTLRPSSGIVEGEPNDLGVLKFFYTSKGVPAIGYGFSSLRALGREGRGGRPLAGVVVADGADVDPGEGVTPELAVRLVAMDPSEDDPLKGWTSESVVDPFGNVSSPNLAALKGTQEKQRTQVHERLKDPAVAEKLVTVLAAALESPVGKPGARNTLYMRRVQAPDAHAMLYGMLDMLSMSPELYEAVGGRWTFSTAVGDHGDKDGNYNALRFMFSSYARSFAPRDAGVSSIRPSRPDSPYAKAATKLVNTFLDGYNIEQTADLIASAGKFDPQNPEAWCQALTA